LQEDFVGAVAAATEIDLRDPAGTDDLAIRLQGYGEGVAALTSSRCSGLEKDQ